MAMQGNPYKAYPLARLIIDLERHEGNRSRPYTDTVGKLTIGVGHNLTDRGLSQDIIRLILLDDIDQAERDLDGVWPRWRLLAPERRLVLLNMAFNLGAERLAGFRRMWTAIGAGDFDEAARQMLDSAWARQVGRRAEELAERMRNGDEGN